MVGKLFLDLGEDYAFDVRRAREVAEGAAQQQPDPIGKVYGPFTTKGVEYWIQSVQWNVWFDVDGKPGPDLPVPIEVFLEQPEVDPQQRAAVRRKAVSLGWRE